MKNFVLLILSFIIFNFGYSQVIQDWSASVAFTDTNSFNSNPVVTAIPEYGMGSLFMFYEKTATQGSDHWIWWKKISDPQSEEEMLIGGFEFVDYRNPQIVYNDYLIFESNALDYYNLFAVKVDEDGLVPGEFYQLTYSQTDIEYFYASSGFYTPVGCWIENGDLMVADIVLNSDSLFFTNIEVLDSGNCFDPVCRHDYIAWRKLVNNESHIYFSERDYGNAPWSEPDTICATGNNIHLSISRILEDDGWTVCWENDGNVYYYDINGWSSPTTPDWPEIDNFYEPSAFHLVIIVDDLPELYSFAGEAGSNRDIYIVDQMWSGELKNLTEDLHFNKNPRLFQGRLYGYFYEVVNIWQTEINGYDVLFGSQATYTIGNVNDEMSSTRFDVMVYPNPVKDHIAFEYPNSDYQNFNLSIFNNQGEIVLQKSDNKEIFYLENIDLQSGVYFYTLKSNKLLKASGKFVVK
ncbi:MAG: T9SS type A sorting domain-containing protein [Bacteroidales bacterium]|nr:T9SS type A sorting domain-containing protein [Bacteroidales bacterium]MCF8402676.1 T9SS type A sorting domain-containing protein [Bacteroidales bacterium]